MRVWFALALLIVCGSALPSARADTGVVAGKPAEGERHDLTPKVRGGGPVTITAVRTLGRNAFRVRNRAAEIVIVPGVGRITKFGLLDAEGESATTAFWSHPNSERDLLPDAEGWRNYGGEKAWPAPQSDWPKIAGHAWPPPKGFDARPYTATVERGNVVLVSAIDAAYGIRVRRTIALGPNLPVMTIETRYEKVQGLPVRVAVWTIAQLRSPERLFALLPETASPAFPHGYSSLLADAPSNLNIEDQRLLSFERDERRKSMISSDGHALLWVGSGPDVLVEDVTPNAAGDADLWPNHGARSQIYTSPGRGDDAHAYVELEVLGRLRALADGQAATAVVRYTLVPRTESDPNVEARKVFRLR